MLPDPSDWVKDEERWDYETHRSERAEQGFSFADWINFDTYIAWVIAEAVRKMKSDGQTMFSFPDEPSSEWERLTYEEYDMMIKGFGQWAEGKDSEQDIIDLDAALDIFKKRFKSLWD